MKRIIIVALAVLAAVSCDREVAVKEPLEVSSPSPSVQITKVSLNDTQKQYVKAGNVMALRFLGQMYHGENFICSPLSLQYALAMTACGAEGETLQEIIDFLGYGSDGIEALNEYSKILLEQLPAVDLDVKLRMTDALLVNNKFPLRPEFSKTVRDSYYAAVENMDFADPAQVAARINDWASRSTDGFISKVLSPDEISENAAAFIMNALYFKAPWAGGEHNPMFREYATIDDKFTLADGKTRTVKMMQNMRWHSYAEMDGYKVLALPYAGGKFFMYILLPDSNDLGGLVSKLKGVSWESILASLKNDAEVYVKLPKFEVENKFYLKKDLVALGVKRAFQTGVAQFDKMFSPQEMDYDYWIEEVIQKSRISITEWGTEAAAVTVVEMGATSAGPGEQPKRVNFYADHPFAFLIGEATSGTILFEGAYTGR